MERVGCETEQFRSLSNFLCYVGRLMMLPARYIDPKTDYGFKLIFSHKPILRSFVNAVLPAADRVVDFEYIGTEVLGGNPAGRIVIYDLRCLTTDGRTIIVELQRLPQPYFKERALYYTMRAFDEQVRRGDEAYGLDPVYLIAVVDYDLPGDYSGYLHRFTLRSDDGAAFSDVLQLFFLELSKIPPVSDATDTLDPLEQWAEAIRHMPALDGIPAWVTEEDLKKAFTVAEVAGLSKEERAKWERAFREDRDLRGQVLQQYIWGKQEGREEGREEARAETAREIAARALAKGLALRDVADLTGLDLEDVQRISAEWP